MAKILAALAESAGAALTTTGIGGRIAAARGSGLRQETISRGLKELVERGMADELTGYPKSWIHSERDVTQ